MNSLIIFGAKYLFVFVVLIYLLAWAQASKKYKIQMAVTLILAGIVAIILDKVGSKVYYDPRPFVTHNVKPLVTHIADNGFPSEHTVFTASLSMALFFFRPKMGIASFVLAVLVGCSRVAAHIHSPIDIVGGLLIGIIAGAAGYYLCPQVMRLWKPKLHGEP
ncbi:MAG TPA: phosphatase PAP2 family protein [Candidatus Saccharimonadales bacterium]|nr:phosphatase PAP2 family protein [Candidatus Saccharimonadales bacterium]